MKDRWRDNRDCELGKISPTLPYWFLIIVVFAIYSILYFTSVEAHWNDRSLLNKFLFIIFCPLGFLISLIFSFFLYNGTLLAVMSLKSQWQNRGWEASIEPFWEKYPFLYFLLFGISIIVVGWTMLNWHKYFGRDWEYALTSFGIIVFLIWGVGSLIIRRLKGKRGG